MGISGLLPLLKSIHKASKLKDFAGQTLGVDAYGWLHRGTVSCAVDLALGKPTTKYVDFAMHRVRMLLHFGVKPYLVFDGDYLPSKAATEEERADRRKDARRAGLELLKAGKSSQAQLELQKAVDVTPEMARNLIDELRKAGVQYVVAPYEADSQLAYLERKGIINGIISEDSDLLVFGARVLLTKLDQYGDCVMLRRVDFTSCREISLVGWTDSEFRQMAILSGCDYMDNIAGMGLKTANRLLRRHKTVDRIIKALQFDGKFKVPQGYLEAFEAAERTFLHQWVFCPLEKRLLNLTPLPSGLSIEDLPYIGCTAEPATAIGVANGHLHPHTKQPIQSSRPTLLPLKANSAKRQIMQTARTPPLKQSKSIESFFKPARTPLAELDPNCLLPSSARRLLSINNSSPSIDSASHSQARPYLRQSLSQSAQPLPSQSPLIRAAPSSNGLVSPSHNAKRARLCSESSPPRRASEDQMKSKFFATPKTFQQTPRRTSPRALKPEMGGEFAIFQDDSAESVLLEARRSIEEAFDEPGTVLGIPRLERVGHREHQKNSKGTSGKGMMSKALVDETQSTSTSESSTTEISQDVTGDFTQATSIGSDAETDTSTAAVMASSSSQIGGSTPAQDANVMKRPSSTGPHLTTVRPTEAGSFILGSQKLEASLNLDMEDHKISKYAFKDGQTSRSSSHSQEAGRSIMPPKVLSTGLSGKGSEDMLVPNSDSGSVASNEDEVQPQDWILVPVSPDAEYSTKSRLNLSGFAYIAPA